MVNPIWILNQTGNILAFNTINREVFGFKSSLNFAVDFSGIMEGEINIIAMSIGSNFSLYLISIYDFFSKIESINLVTPIFEIVGAAHDDNFYGGDSFTLPSGKYVVKLTNLSQDFEIRVAGTSNTLSW